MTRAPFDPYALRPGGVEEPPATAWRAVTRLGPGMVLAASIVGSGELIATTTLGAQAGFVALWVILLSCAVKPAVQAELGRYTIATGETGLEALDRMPGPRLGASWLLWAWAVTVLLSMLQVGGMYGGLAQVMNLLVPSVPVPAWAVVFLVLTLALLLGGGYERIERLALVKVALFTLLTVLAALVLTRQGEHFSWARVAEGLRFRLPETGFATAVAVFGITGVGATELFMYPYWCVEKGYARFVGPNDGTASRLARARGWIRLMHADVAASMVLYTLATLAFYLLGAGVLSPLGLVPAANDMIPTLSRLYTDTLGGWVLPLFYLGATLTLYGTIFAATAAHSRLYADFCRVLGFFDRADYARRLAFRRGFTVLLTVVPVLLYLYFESPVKMVVAGGVSQSVMLPITGAGALYLHHRRLPRELRPGPLVTAGLWIATVVMAVVTAYSLVALAGGR
ncbi:MAG TPA: Nramp family divalent metal transporter [Vicinamibacteria bacterium]